ncbi:hypothetical protein [Nocardioides terrigena]|uniref:hypothetical protein n=1 Tax=Nocardioides terrigena TaxID=424797 RepID=UPI000D323EF5|nr:hypothetical protein [Nocardioides terrigena]
MTSSGEGTGARDAGTTESGSSLWELSAHRDKAVRAAAARNPSTPTDLLKMLAADKHHLVRFAVAENPNPRAWAVALGAADSDVRVILAQRGDLDGETLERLIIAPEREVRVSVVESTDRADVVRRLARDPDVHVRAAAATRPELLSDADLELLAADRIAQVRAVAVQSRRLSPRTVTRLAADRSGNVRYFTLHAHPERLDLAKIMQEDKETDIAELARRRLPPALRDGPRT